MTKPRQLTLITGASSGIGLELARVFAREGHDLVLVARREPELNTLAAELKSRYGADSTVITADLSLPDGPQTVYDTVVAADLDVEILINNAGLGGHGRFATTDPTVDHQIIAVNVVALTTMTKLFLPAMIEQRRGHVVNVASTAAFQPGPFMATYYASKAYVLSLTEAIAEELSGTGVTATALCPGVVPTGFQAAADLGDRAPMLNSPATKSAEFVAQAAYDGVMSGKRIVIPGTLNKIGAQSIRLAPRSLIVKMTKRLHPPID